MTRRAGTRVAVITGASSGIGEATARLLSRGGWHCVLVARNEERLRSLAAEIGGEIEPCDLGDRVAVECVTARIVDRHPEVDLLVNNAGMLAQGTFDEVDLDVIEEVARVNYLGGVWMTRGLLPALAAAARDDGAHVVNVVSIAGTIAFPPAGAYAASKHAQLAFSRSLRATLRPHGVEVHTVMPGFVETPGFPHPKVFGTRLGSLLVVGPERVARSIVRAVERGRTEVVVPWFPYRLGGAAQALFPSLTTRMLSHATYADAGPHDPERDRQERSEVDRDRRRMRRPRA